jgi:hypothetical protein
MQNYYTNEGKCKVFIDLLKCYSILTENKQKIQFKLTFAV